MVRIEPPSAASISGSAARATATSEYALTSTASQKRSRGVSVKRPSRSVASANATEWTSRSSCPPNASPTSPKTRSRSSSARTSQAVTSGESTDSASSRTFFSIRSPWYVNASEAPPAASRLAIAQAIERRLATPKTSPRLPAKMSLGTRESCATLRILAPPTRSLPLLSGARPPRGLRCRGPAQAHPPAAHGRARAPTPAPRRDQDPRRAGVRPRHRDCRPAPAAARDRAWPRLPLGPPARQAEPLHVRLARLPRAALRGPGRRRRTDPPRDPERAVPGALPHRPRRARGEPAVRQAAGARADFGRAQGLPERRLPPRHQQEPRRDPRRPVLGRDRRVRPGDQDRGRRRRDRPDEPVLQPGRLLVPGRLPEGPDQVHDAEGDRRAGVPGARLRQAGAAPDLPRRLVPRDARRRDRGRRAGHRCAARARPPARHGPLGDRTAGLARQLPRLQHAGPDRWLRRLHAADHRRVRERGRRWNGRDQLLRRRAP